MPIPLRLQPITLEGRHVLLEHLAEEHEAGLAEAVADGELWNLWYTSVPSPGTMRAEIRQRLQQGAAGSMLPFTVRSLPGRGIVGMTTFMNVDAENRRLEIGSTWYARHVQRTALNTEAKLLLLTHAFDSLGCVAVEFRTHLFNQQSRRAIERLGARLDGILRNHRLLPDGTLRDTCVYSILNSEWPAVRNHLRWQLDRPR